MGLISGAIPYCGLAPFPAELMSRWNMDPVLIGLLVLTALAYATGASLNRKRGHVSGLQQIFFYAGWLVATLALISPLCALSVSLLSACVGQHVILTMIAAPLLAFGRPAQVFSNIWRGALSGWLNRPAAVWFSAGLFAVVLWFWHAPIPYAATFASPSIYWTMHFSLFGSALWLWVMLLDLASVGAGAAIFAGVATSVHMGLLGALLTFSPKALFTPHLLTTAAWSLSPLQDQQLAGVLMWIPSGFVMTALPILVLSRILSRPGWLGPWRPALVERQ